jgi:hypothetical protein
MRAELAEAHRRAALVEAHSQQAMAAEFKEREDARVWSLENQARLLLGEAERERLLASERYEQERAIDRQRFISELMQMQAMVKEQEARATQHEAAAHAAIKTLHEQCLIPPARRARPTVDRPVVPKLNLGPSDHERGKIKITMVHISKA